MCNYHSPDAAPRKAKAVSLYEFSGLAKVPVTEATAGNIIAMSGIGDVTIGDTICAAGVVGAAAVREDLRADDGNDVLRQQLSLRRTRGQVCHQPPDPRPPLPRNAQGRFPARRRTSRAAPTASTLPDAAKCTLSILIETMRREGYEFQVSPPRVLMQRDEKGNLMEPMEELVADVPQEYVGSVIEKLGTRKAELKEMTPVGARMRLIFLVPSRGLFGYRNEFLTDTHGEGIMASVFDSYAPYKGEVTRRSTGSLIAWEQGEAVAYGIWNAQERGIMFITPGTPVYGGMIVGVSPKQEDIPVNVCTHEASHEHPRLRLG